MSRLTGYDHDGLVFDVIDAGPIDGDPVVLLHGFPERATCWREVAPLLHEAGLRTYAPDQRGYSPGARPPRRRDYTVDRLMGDVVALIEQIGRPVHLVGHDWGANSAWLAAMHRPDLVRTLTAISVPHPAAFGEAVLRSAQAFSSWYMAAFQVPVLPELLLTRPHGRIERSLRRGGMTPDDVARFRREIVDDGALTGGINWYRALPFAPRHLLAKRVEVPTTMVWSDGDRFIRRGTVERCGRFVAAPYELRILTGVSHWVPTHAPAAAAGAALSRIGVTR